MWLRRDSPAGVRFFAALKEGRRLKPSARIAGVGKATAQRWVREAFLALRNDGLTILEAQEMLGFASSLMAGWDRERQVGDGRHHLRRALAVEIDFWAGIAAGSSVEVACQQAGVGRSTGYRWQQARFAVLREQGVAVRSAARQVSTSPARASRWELERRTLRDARLRTEQAAVRAAVRQSALHAQLLQQRRARPRADAREKEYWRLRGTGMSSFAACTVMGMDHRTGFNIRRRRARQVAEQDREASWTGRFLSLPERLQIADLLRLNTSQRGIALRLGRSPSTVSRELARHRDPGGQYQPYQADQAARQQRQRPRQPKLLADDRLRAVVQRKLNRCWSPEQIAGWLDTLHPGRPDRTVCAETIYQALLVPGRRCLHRRYTARLRTGRRVRRPHVLTRSVKGGAVKNMTMIADRPAEVQARIEPGHWEGDLIIGAGSASAMITLRERVTHYGLIINLPVDHTARTVNTALQRAFAAIPAHLAKTLTWDQGTEMARHQELAATSTLKIYFAERSSPWQRGANENFNGLVRQYFPKNTDLSIHTPQHVTAVTKELNDRPRKTLGYQTPTTRFRTACQAT